MKVKINYEGKEVWVDDQVKECLDQLAREESVQSRRNRRHELLWDAWLIDGIEDSVMASVSIEEEIIKAMYIEAIEKLVGELEPIDKQMITERFIHKLKYREMAEKYAMPATSIQYRIEKSLKEMRKKFNNILKEL